MINAIQDGNAPRGLCVIGLKEHRHGVPPARQGLEILTTFNSMALGRL